MVLGYENGPEGREVGLQHNQSPSLRGLIFVTIWTCCELSLVSLLWKPGRISTFKETLVDSQG